VAGAVDEKLTEAAKEIGEVSDEEILQSLP
jgi:hypothetical protein